MYSFSGISSHFEKLAEIPSPRILVIRFFSLVLTVRKYTRFNGRFLHDHLIVQFPKTASCSAPFYVILALGLRARDPRSAIPIEALFRSLSSSRSSKSPFSCTLTVNLESSFARSQFVLNFRSVIRSSVRRFPTHSLN